MDRFDPADLVRDYGDIDGEARACRNACALFDFSFMSRARISGDGARTALVALQSRSMDGLRPGSIRYALRVDGEGAVLIDLTVWNIGGGCYDVMCGRHADITDLAAMCGADTAYEDRSADSVIFAVQGPESLHAFARLTDTHALGKLAYFTHGRFDIAGIDCRIGRLGYTGEKGFEVIAPVAKGKALWEALALRARPAGFAATDCLRIEAGFILFANECRFGVTADELGLANFGGGGNDRPPRMRLVGFRAETVEKPILWQPRIDAVLSRAPGDITITSACHSVAENCTIGLGFVAGTAGIDAEDAGGIFGRVRLTPIPIFDPEKKRPREVWPSKDGSHDRE